MNQLLRAALQWRGRFDLLNLLLTMLLFQLCRYMHNINLLWSRKSVCQAYASCQ